MADTLVLNADAQPLSLLPLSTIQWQEAVKYLWLDKVTVLDWYDDWVVRSASWETKVPAVVMLKEYMRVKTSVRFSKSNVFLRDEFICQYCRKPLAKKFATLDHILPISKGGKTNWTNVVCACGPCNQEKSDKIGRKPIRPPYRPDYWELVSKRRHLPYHVKHKGWLDYLGSN